MTRKMTEEEILQAARASSPPTDEHVMLASLRIRGCHGGTNLQAQIGQVDAALGRAVRRLHEARQAWQKLRSAERRDPRAVLAAARALAAAEAEATEAGTLLRLLHSEYGRVRAHLGRKPRRPRRKH